MNSIKKSLLTLMFLTAGQLLYAQGIRPGLKVGYNHSYIKVDGEEDLDYSSGYHVGFIVSVPVAEKVNFQPGIFYSLKGAQSNEEESYTLESGTVVSYRYKADVRLSYIEIPLGISYALSNRFHFQVTSLCSISDE